VYNHTAEGNHLGPTLSFRGIDNRAYYFHRATDRRFYDDVTGCGNTVSCNHPLVASFIVNCLEYWADEMGVDGFRFDLASVFARGEDGRVLADPMLPWNIELSRILVERPLIAEAWDAAGAYHVGAFPGMRWAEWNGRYRDLVRRFVRGDPGLIAEVATRLAGSSDLFADDLRPPASSVNFVTCHDGFTLADLVAYNGKHNEANGEENRDGHSHNRSWNHGAEGQTEDEAILGLRKRQMKNILATLLLSQGTPMLLAGDEFARTQNGNNNAYCQDNEISWLDWNHDERAERLIRFVRRLTSLRHRFPILRQKRFLSGVYNEELGLKDVTWVSATGREMTEAEWKDGNTRCFGMLLDGRAQQSGIRQRGHEATLLIVFNTWQDVVKFALPDINGGGEWSLLADTNMPDLPEGSRFPIGHPYEVTGRSLLLLELA